MTTYDTSNPICAALLAAKSLIADPNWWTKCAAARNRWGNGVDPSDPTAVRWCAVGAIEKVAPGLPLDDQLCRRLIYANNYGGHAVVMRAFDEELKAFELRPRANWRWLFDEPELVDSAELADYSTKELKPIQRFVEVQWDPKLDNEAER